MTWRSPEFLHKLQQPILVVGAGGIGCELLKNLVLTGFRNIHVIDLDTIDVSNLNRQFLFRKEHVGKSKAQVAADAARSICPDVKIKHYHDSIMKDDYGVEFFQQFVIVLNALDNKAARSHVNRLCLGAGVPLVESGSSGYLGQVAVILKGKTECYECVPKPAQKTFPGCTIRNTPSEPIHCIVWAKSLFNQLFGEVDPDDDVSPDPNDEENQNPKNNASMSKSSSAASMEANGLSSENSKPASEFSDKLSTRAWAAFNNYDPEKLFNKLFFDDINYLLSMSNLWKERRRPTPLLWADLLNGQGSSRESSANNMWSIDKWCDIYEKALHELSARFADAAKENRVLTWDKDDEPSMHFVAACANIRSHIFHIQEKTLFDVKSMAGNIVPAIATTNACVAGMIVVEALKVIQGELDKLRSVYILRQPNPRGKILSDDQPVGPNPNCYVCSSKKREIFVRLNVHTMTVKTFETKILKQTLNMVAPDVIDMFTNRIIISSEEGETDALMDKPLSELGVKTGSQFDCDDYLQKFEIRIMLMHHDEFKSDEFELTDDPHASSSHQIENGVLPETSATPIAENIRAVEEHHKNGAKEESNGQPTDATALEDGELPMDSEDWNIKPNWVAGESAVELTHEDFFKNVDIDDERVCVRADDLIKLLNEKLAEKILLNGHSPAQKRKAVFTNDEEVTSPKRSRVIE